MSYTELYYVTPSGQVKLSYEFKNSWLGAMLVWTQLYKRYFPERVQAMARLLDLQEPGPITEEDYQCVWNLGRDPRLSHAERIVLRSTFDGCILERPQFAQFHLNVLEYAATYQAGSLIAQAEQICRLRRKKILGVCWNQTSVSDGVWHAGHIRAVDHWFLYQTTQAIEVELQNAASEKLVTKPG